MAKEKKSCFTLEGSREEGGERASKYTQEDCSAGFLGEKKVHARSFAVVEKKKKVRTKWWAFGGGKEKRPNGKFGGLH